jgi:hypothetical protein
MFNRLRMLAANAAPQMDSGETVKATVIGRVNSNAASFDSFSLDLATNDVAGDEAIGASYGNPKDPNYAVMATERNLYVFRLRPRSFTKFDELTRKDAIGSVGVALAKGSGSLLIGNLNMGTGFQRSRARRVVAAVGGDVMDDQAFYERQQQISLAQRAEEEAAG